MTIGYLTSALAGIASTVHSCTQCAVHHFRQYIVYANCKHRMTIFNEAIRVTIFFFNRIWENRAPANSYTLLTMRLMPDCRFVDCTKKNSKQLNKSIQAKFHRSPIQFNVQLSIEIINDRSFFSARCPSSSLRFAKREFVGTI